MTTFTGSNTWHASITGPDPAATVTAASVVDGDTLLADRTVYLHTAYGEANHLVNSGEVVLDGTASIIDLKAITTLTSIGLTSDALPALQVDDVILVHAMFGILLDGANELRFAIDHDAAPLIVASESRYLLSSASAILHLHCFARFAIAAPIAAGSKVRLVARCAAGGNTATRIYRAASIQWSHFRKGFS